jgi:hypothetical protein
LFRGPLGRSEQTNGSAGWPLSATSAEVGRYQLERYADQALGQFVGGLVAGGQLVGRVILVAGLGLGREFVAGLPVVSRPTGIGVILVAGLGAAAVPG